MSQHHNAPQPQIDARGLLIFDGQCGFCRRWVRYMTTWFSQHPAPVAWQDTDLASLGLTAEQCNTAVQFVSIDRRISSGSDAAARVLIVAGFPFNIAGRIMLLPGISFIAQSAYKWVANNRRRFKGDPIEP